MPTFTYTTIEAMPGRVADLVSALRAESDTERVAVFGAQIGWPAGEVRILRHGDDTGIRAEVLRRLVDDGVVAPRSVHAETLAATVRPTGRLTLPPDGVYAHRWFELRPDASVEEFVRLSLAAWEAGFETLYDATPMGLFRAPTMGVTRRMLLITRYGSLADWSESRAAGRSDEGQAGVVGGHLRARGALTARTWVCSSLVVA